MWKIDLELLRESSLSKKNWVLGLELLKELCLMSKYWGLGLELLRESSLMAKKSSFLPPKCPPLGAPRTWVVFSQVEKGAGVHPKHEEKKPKLGKKTLKMMELRGWSSDFLDFLQDWSRSSNPLYPHCTCGHQRTNFSGISDFISPPLSLCPLQGQGSQLAI